MKKVFLFLLYVLSSIICFAQTAEKLSVYFRFNDYTLDLISKNKIDSLLKSSSLKELKIEAYCDSFGSNAYNDSLSLKRAMEVRKYFISKGVNDSLIKIKALGKSSQVNNSGNGDLQALNRRADIFFVAQNVKLASKPKSTAQDTSLFNMDSVEVGSTIELKNLKFRGGRHSLVYKFYNVLLLLLETMNKYPKLEIEIQGYTEADSLYGFDIDTKKWELSINRAKMVYEYLIQKGIKASRLSYKGFAANIEPVITYRTQNKSNNQIVVIKVIKK